MPPYPTYTETNLLQGLQDHGEQAFSYLYDNYSKALFNVVFQIISQQELAEDILQEVFVKIWQNINSYDAAKGRLYTLMLNITRNLAIDRIRSKDDNNQTKTTGLKENVYEIKSVQSMKVFPEAYAFAITLEHKSGNPTPTMEEMYVMGKAS